ncbi:SdrD B-like domain-containing protein, partial [Botrimarina sp.]|uniref:SdrD B-like domain-containing protein n=1 Tax=Botrimarina sp. TaxID=2795802 RepID=UPI0032EC6413
MGLISSLLNRRARRLPKAPRRASVERMEPRQMLAADVLLGSVYFEEATGDDSQPDLLQVSFVGGAAGTTLDRLVIDGDKLGDGLSTGDVFFDTEPGEPGSFKSVGLSVVESVGFQVTGVEVLDGGTAIAFTFEGFEAGEVLVFSVDVDEAQFVAGDTIDTNSLVEGAEFQRSILTGNFSAPGHVDLSVQALYFDAFDATFAAEESAAGAELSQLPDDAYQPGDDFTDRTAGAVARAAQIEYASLSGYVYHDRSDDGLRDAGEEAIGGVTLELIDASGQGTGVYATTDALGYYRFTDLEAG